MTVEREDFVQAMRSVANSVAVVTTNGVAGRHGATVIILHDVAKEDWGAAGALMADKYPD